LRRLKNQQLPTWFKQELPDKAALSLGTLISGYGLRTVCQEAKCPNLSACFKSKQATFLILGGRCSRSCRFCNIAKKGDGSEPSPFFCEPFLISEAAKKLGLRYCVLTSVARDDLVDGGAGQFAQTIHTLRAINQGIKIEVLIPDFQGSKESIAEVVAAVPDVLGHNLETVSRLYLALRPQADYQRSLQVLARAKQLRAGLITKSSLMLGLGESEAEIIQAASDLRKVNCDILTLGQYLAPSARHYPVQEFITPEQFQYLGSLCRSMGFKAVFSGPLVRSSYLAEQAFQEVSGCMI